MHQKGCRLSAIKTLTAVIFVDIYKKLIKRANLINYRQIDRFLIIFRACFVISPRRKERKEIIVDCMKPDRFIFIYSTAFAFSRTLR